MAAGSQTAISAPVLAPVVVAPAARVVAPIAGADVVAPADQLYANVRHVAFNLCIGLAGTAQAHEQDGDAFAGVPVTLVIQPDGMVSRSRRHERDRRGLRLRVKPSCRPLTNPAGCTAGARARTKH